MSIWWSTWSFWLRSSLITRSSPVSVMSIDLHRLNMECLWFMDVLNKTYWITMVWFSVLSAISFRYELRIWLLRIHHFSIIWIISSIKFFSAVIIATIRVLWFISSNLSQISIFAFKPCTIVVIICFVNRPGYITISGFLDLISFIPNYSNCSISKFSQNVLR